jgi:hypothetical protein
MFHCKQVFRAEGLIYMVQEYGEIDLARLLSKHDTARREASGAGEQRTLLQDNLDENFIRLYWQQMLQVCFAWHQLIEPSGTASIQHADKRPVLELHDMLSPHSPQNAMMLMVVLHDKYFFKTQQKQPRNVVCAAFGAQYS